jgi:hypothetical protein
MQNGPVSRAARHALMRIINHGPHATNNAFIFFSALAST